VTRSPRRHPQWRLVPARPSLSLARGHAILIAALAALACSAGLAVLAPSAGAKVITIENTERTERTEKFGIEARNAYGNEIGRSPGTFENPEGYPVLHAANIYAIYWDPTNTYDDDWQQMIDEFLRNMETAQGQYSEGQFNTDFAVDADYRDATNKPATAKPNYRGSYTDTNAYPPAGCVDPEPLVSGSFTCLTDAEVRLQLEAFIAEHRLPRGMSTIYYVLTPPDVTVCLDKGGPTGHCSDHVEDTVIPEDHEQYVLASESYKNSFCSYHGAITPTNPETGDEHTILYGMIPWTAGNDGQLDSLNPVKGYDCQDGGFDPTTKPIEKKEAPSEAAREAEEQKERQEKTGEEEKCEKRLKEASAEATEEIETECAAELRAIEKAAEKEFANIKTQEEKEEPRIQEPNQNPNDAVDLDGDFDEALPDVLINEIAVEEQNIVTDPLLNAWHDRNGNELVDECRNFFWTPTLAGQSAAQEESRAGTLSNETLAGQTYYLNDTFLLSDLDFPGSGCQDFVDLAPHFTAPDVVNSGEVVGFDGMESDISLNWSGLSPSLPGSYATYRWNFGDGSPEVSGFAPGAPACHEPWLSPCAASVFHTYEYGGTYRVTLTVTDTGGNVESTFQELTVDGPARSSSSGGGEGGGSPGGGSKTPGTSSGSPSPGGGSTSGSPGGATTSTTVPPPTATAATTSTSIRDAIKHGLTIHYSVNEQVAGTIEVLLAASTAKHLHLRGPAAVGLPAGAPKSIVIGRAVLVTTKGGTGAVRLKLSKAAAKALRKLKHVTLTLRVVVRNASRTNPASTSLLSTFVLHH